MILLLMAWACAPDDSKTSLPEADRDGFVTVVQPVIESTCANPSCHGAIDRPFEVYAVGLHRIDAESLHLDTPLTEEELDRNFDRARAFLSELTEAAECELLLKPLAIEEGGIEHGGGVQFEDAQEPGYLALYEWADAALEAE